MREPKRHLTQSGSEVWRVRFRLKPTPDAKAEDTSESFYGVDGRADAIAFSKMIDAIGTVAAVKWLRDQSTDKKTTTPTLSEWADRYIDSLPAVTVGTREGYRRCYAHSFGKHLGAIPLELIDREAIAKTINILAERGGLKGKGFSDKSIANQHGLLAAMMATAHADGIIPTNPCKRITLPRRTNHKTADMHLLSRAEFAALYDKITNHYKPLVLTLIGTGIRWGEAEALTVGDALLDDGLIRINKAAKWTGVGSGREVGPTKTRKSNRTVTLPREVVEALRPLVIGRPKSATLFTAPRGGKLVHKTFWEHTWRPACRAAGFDPLPRIHDLRHSHASWLIAAKVPLPIIQARLGHEKITTTVDTYGHLAPDAQQAAADAADLVLGDLSVPKAIAT